MANKSPRSENSGKKSSDREPTRIATPAPINHGTKIAVEASLRRSVLWTKSA